MMADLPEPAGERAVPIPSISLGQAFNPRRSEKWSLALESVCETSGLRMTDDPATRFVAEKIIELTQRGVRGDELRSVTLKKFKHEE